MHTEALVCPLSAPFPTALPQLSTRSLPPPRNSPPYPSPTTLPAPPCGQQHPIRPLSLGAAQVMQNSREEHAECELMGLGFRTGAASSASCASPSEPTFAQSRPNRKINKLKSIQPQRRFQRALRESTSHISRTESSEG
ncbi:hypothetical protein CesoFtcFv8_014314 [Champsocephalus esox]|uniref:Uncharacterized protein n=1 Tax=Champsocephalus esox TaxID=159716 RepID=A0AAN8BSK1_9TELE|nr:hypothetical protein CesoFtcFv8_014314 [Champsocephalus esox]